MYPASRLRQRYMFLPEDRLVLHVTGQLRQCYMFLPEDPPPGDDENIAWRTPELAPLEPRIQNRPVGRVRILGSVWSRLPGRVTFTPFQIGA